MREPNHNHTKKIAIDFGLVPRKILNEEMFRPTQIQVGARPVPHIFGNCTWRQHPFFTQGTIAQIVFTSSDEKKLMRIVDKYKGKIVTPRMDINQWQILETSRSGLEEKVELSNETLNPKSFDYTPKK